MQLIGAGFPRTGTLSCQAALEILFEGDCYHMKTIVASKEHLKLWSDATLAGVTPDLAEITSEYSACVDAPLCFYYEELMELYPEAKVLLTERDADGWYDSWSGLMKTLHRAKLVGLVNGRFRKFFKFATELNTTHGIDGDRDACIESFEKHNAAVKATVPADRLLVFNVKQGWEPLCEFLGVDVPDEPFPHLNSGSGALREAITKLVFRRDLSNVGTK